MSERQINDPQSTPQAPASVDAAARQLASARRRRFIKMGGAVVPTALTLASRPVMAWHCNTASTWGSVQGLNNSAYARSRQENVTWIVDETYTVANWVANTGRGGLASLPWTLTPLSCSTDPKVSKFYQNYTVAQLLSPDSASIYGITDTSDSVWRILKNDTKYPIKAGNTSNEFTRLMLAAWLNYRVLSSTLDRCLKPTKTTNTLVKLGSRTFVGPTGKRWYEAEVITYLKGNYVACNNDGSGLCN